MFLLKKIFYTPVTNALNYWIGWFRISLIMGRWCPCFKTPTITEVMCNGPHAIYVERNGIIEESNIVFEK